MSAEGYDPSSELPTHTDMSTADDSAPAPTTNGTSEPTLKDAFVNNAASAVNTVTEHPITQNIVNGPVATSVKDQAASTKSEFSDLASSRQPPSYTAANDTTLTHYHSFFYTLLSWKNKRATGITFASVVAFIFACRYLPIIRYVIKITWMTLGVVTLAEGSSKALMGSSVAGTLRPRRYYKIPKETLEASLDDLENLINFFVIEIQRIVFAENVPVTAAAFLTAFLTYYLIKIVPFWGMALIASCALFLGPLIYIENKEFIDSQLEHAGNVIGQQTTQIRDLTAQHTSKGLDTMKQYTGTYAAKAQEMVGGARQRIPSPTTGKAPVKEGDFPSAPKTDLPDTSDDVLHRQAEPLSS
ncbi:hypothetical protein Z517_07404 [Fonsecaea pedrosoi CBS 271.37]|uniref:Reticulon-like protein n=1 Tax=Fonsecaea pedrosoi CBS 271.37 TaxID=1442368 RepID=A0A0D2F2A5_9EURO|nr:uncharacterized protein Z517_07404 [Fonsecaea pedrosoi CBS 271.37]KIW80787.1 hypothetical protein Z517_07404 [Fonsecaea pedrosoi CBS 271.37]